MSGLERDARALLDDLAAADVAVYVEGGKLMRRAGVGNPIPAKLRERLDPLRAEVVAILSGQRRREPGVGNPRKPSPELVAVLGEEDAEALEALMASWPHRSPPQMPGTNQRAAPPAPWEGAEAELVAWAQGLTEADLPPCPFWLRPGVRVTSPAALSSWLADIAQGARGPRAKTGALQRDLENLRDVIATAENQTQGFDIPNIADARPATRRPPERSPPRRRPTA